MNHDNRKRIRTYHATDRRWSLHHGDVQTVLPMFGNSLYDGTLFDPPYGLKFMGHDWDEVVPPVEVFQQLLDACKPGAYLVAFGGPKTFHRLTCNIEDGGWEIRDTLCWLYGEGFPKSHNLSKAIDKELGAERPSVGETKDIYRYGYNQSGKRIEITTAGSGEANAWEGYGTALKPAWEPIVLAQKPREKNFAKNALRHGCGGLNIDGCRIGTTGGSTRSHQAVYPRLAEGTEDRSNLKRSGHRVESISKGRWPANLILDEEAAEALDQQSGASRSRRCNRRTAESNIGNGRTLHHFKARIDVVEGYDDEGGASRFFYVPKVRGKKRQGNEHPTVKPVELCEYLAQLILPPERKTPRRLLVPYCGSGSEMLGALSAGWDHATGIEMESKWVSLARKRLSNSTFQNCNSAKTKVTPSSSLEKKVSRPVGRTKTTCVNSVTVGDCRDLISSLPDNSVNLSLTSPPYADQRKGLYPGIPEEEYPEFTVDWMSKLWSKLADDGSVLIVIRPHIRKGQISDYVMKTRLALREQGWNECEELIWLKPDGGGFQGSNHRPRRAYEHILWFSKTHNPFIDTKICGGWSNNIAFRGSTRFGLGNDKPVHKGQSQKKKSGGTRLPDVITVPMGGISNGLMHPAMFPIPLAECLIKTFCPEGGTVLDNFCGSGTSLIAAKKLSRTFYGFDIKKEYVAMAQKRLNDLDGDGLGCSLAG